VPCFHLNDGPQGFRGDAGTSTSWPASLTVAAAWDPEAMRLWGAAMGDEFYRKGAHVQLGPGLCVARIPRNGRNFEYLSGEDPYLGYVLAKPVVEGIQSAGVVANAKHWVNNNQETDRGTISENVDERTQFEIYYPVFEGAIAGNVGSFMCSYNKVCQNCNATEIGKWSCENPDTLKVDLKERLGFKGFVMSDWGATHSTSINEGLDQEQPGSDYMAAKLKAMVESGEVTQEKVDDSAVRTLWPIFQVGLFDKPNNNTQSTNVTTEAHRQLAKDLSSQGTVLLKNDGVLPLKPEGPLNIAVIGSQAQLPVVHGGGSGEVIPSRVKDPLTSIRAWVGLPPLPAPINNCSNKAYETGVDFFNNDGQSELDATSVDECCQMCSARGDCVGFSYQTARKQCWMKSDTKNRVPNSEVISGVCKNTPVPGVDCNKDVCVHYSEGLDHAEAVALATAADVTLIFGATTSSEGSDRGDLTLGDTDSLIVDVAEAAGNKVVVIAVTPGALLTPWRDQVGAVLTPLMPGQEYGDAIAEVLFGTVNPGGKLPLTFPNAANEMEITKEQWPGVAGAAFYSEKLEVGYRWYAAHDVKPAYPFGHGLSYTSFEYANLVVSGRTVTVEVSNTGAREGQEVAQLYVKFPAEAGEPPMQLKGFSKVELKAGETQTATFTLDDRTFSIWDVTTHAWAVVPGTFQLMVGSSSGDIRVTANTTSSVVAYV